MGASSTTLLTSRMLEHWIAIGDMYGTVRPQTRVCLVDGTGKAIPCSQCWHTIMMMFLVPSVAYVTFC